MKMERSVQPKPVGESMAEGKAEVPIRYEKRMRNAAG